MQLREQLDLGRRHPPYQVLGRQLRWMIQACRGEHFRQRLERVAMEVEYALGLVRDHQCTLTQGILGSNAGRAFVGVAALRLNATVVYRPQISTTCL